MYTQGEKIIPRPIEDEVKDSYLSYSMSVIVGRALPDVRDGLKPVHRRILYAMRELGLEHNKPYKKCARITGETLGKYHPHGDAAVYDALVRMVQDFSLRYPLIDGQGNFGSVDGDSAAAMRYTEARLTAIAGEILADIDKETVDLGPNFDDTLTEPLVLPSAIPNLLVNGSSGIAVGMATNIPSHNLSEVIDALTMLIEKPDIEVKDLMRAIKGPDFPTGGIICGREGIKQAYLEGRGLLKLHARANIETQKSGKESIVVTEIPYQVNKANLIESIADLVQQKKIEGISDLRDESDKDGMRIVIELKRDANAQVALNQLYKHTQMQSTFGVIMLALVNGQPRVFNLKQYLQFYLDHRKDIVVRRTQFDLNKAQDRAHILEGLKIAISNLDKVIKTIKQSKSPQEAKLSLVKNFNLSDKQAQAILEMQLQRLTALERDKVDEEYLGLIKRIELYKSILASERKVMDIIKGELAEIKRRYHDERRTEIISEAAELEIEDLIAEEDMVITVTHTGYIKRLSVSSYRKQKRGGVGVTAMDTKDEDFVEDVFIASTHDYLIFFTNKGRAYWLKVYDIPQAGRAAKGRPIVNLINLASGESISTFVDVREFSEDRFLVMVTKNGIIKKTKLSLYGNVRKTGIIAVTLEKDNELIEAKITDGKQDLLLVTQQGKAIRFPEEQVRDMGRTAKGVKAITLSKRDRLIAMVVARKDDTLLTVTSGGFGKRTKVSEYRLQRRGGRGVINIRITNKNKEAIGAKATTDKDELMLLTQGGMIVRCPVKDIRVTGRNSQGVKLISLKGKDRVSSIARVAPEEE